MDAACSLFISVNNKLEAWCGCTSVKHRLSFNDPVRPSLQFLCYIHDVEI